MCFVVLTRGEMKFFPDRDTNRVGVSETLLLASMPVAPVLVSWGAHPLLSICPIAISVPTATIFTSTVATTCAPGQPPKNEKTHELTMLAESGVRIILRCTERRRIDAWYRKLKSATNDFVGMEQAKEEQELNEMVSKRQFRKTIVSGYL